MDSGVFDDALRAFVRRTPFQPFVVELLSGTRFRIEHPEAFVFNSGMAAYISKDRNLAIFDNNSVSQITTASEAVPAK